MLLITLVRNEKNRQSQKDMKTASGECVSKTQERLFFKYTRSKLYKIGEWLNEFKDKKV